MNKPIVPFKDYDWPCEYEKPLIHQVATFKELVKHKRIYLLNTMGTGKTLSTLWASDFLGLNRKISKVLIVAPLSTINSVWRDEIIYHIKRRPVTVLHHPVKAKRIELLERDSFYYIINHDGVKLIEKELKEKKFDLIIIDELTAFKNAQTDRSNAMQRLSASVKAVWGLTGSMTANNILDAYGQLRVIDVKKERYPRYFSQFRNLLTTQFDEYTYIPKPGWEKMLANMVKPSVRFELEDCVDLPEIVYSTREVKMTAKQEKAYAEMKKHFMVELDEGIITAANAAVKMMKLMQISCGAVFNIEGEIVEIGSSKKLDECYNIYQELSRKKLIIFSPYRSGISNILEFFKKKGIRAAVVHGGVSSKERSKIFHEFQHGLLEILIMQPNTAAHGLTLHASNTIIWYGPPLSNDIFIQANHRIRRSGQKYSQLILMLVSSQIEKQIYKSLMNKEANNKLLLSLLKT